MNIHTDAESKEEDVDKCLDGIANLNAGEENDSDDEDSQSTYISCIEGVGFLEVNAKHQRQKCTTCNRNRVYLDNCATNHSMFAVEHLE